MYMYREDKTSASWASQPVKFLDSMLHLSWLYLVIFLHVSNFPHLLVNADKKSI